MTYILNYSPRSQINLRTIRIASRALALAKLYFTVTVHSLASLPPAISRAYAMAYANPYQPQERKKDHSDPQNF